MCHTWLRRKAEDADYQESKNAALKELMALKEELTISMEPENLYKRAANFLRASLFYMLPPYDTHDASRFTFAR